MSDVDCDSDIAGVEIRLGIATLIAHISSLRRM